MRIFLLIFLLSWTLSSPAQDWKRLSQDPIRLEYKIPSNWYVGGIWGEKQCKCTGASMNVAPDYTLSMIIMSSNQYGLDSLERQKIGEHTFGSSSATPNIVKTNNFEFKQTFSTWKEDSKVAVLKFSAQKSTSNPNNYLIYFWGSPENISKHSGIITKIIKSVKTLEKS